jgi:hypothetical protein
MKNRPLLFWFLFGCLIFAVPAYLLLDRSPAVETVIHMEPDVVHPGQNAEAVWTVKTLRPHCRGRVHRAMVDSQKRVFGFESVDAVIHAPVGDVRTFHFGWVIPLGMSPGPAILRRNTDRWCNPLQQWLWPMQEIHEAKFTVEP